MNQTNKDTYNAQVATIKTFIDAKQASYKASEGKYKQYMPTNTINAVTYDFSTSINEHTFPDGSHGYTYYFSYNDGTNDYFKKSGSEGEVDWTLIDENF